MVENSSLISGETGFVDASMIERNFGQKKDGEKVMAFVCGPPGQVKSLAGPKDGPRQGPLLGRLRSLEYIHKRQY